MTPTTSPIRACLRLIRSFACAVAVKPVDQRAVEIEERPDLRTGRACADLRDRICCRRLRAHRAQAYVAAYRPRPVTSGISSVVRMPGSAATTSGMAFTIRLAAARMAA